ncbi:MAG: ROK family protein [Pyrinomonadaceae bacterium]|nr:ROK family protein [Pyrinomonadaceae bacterium]
MQQLILAADLGGTNVRMAVVSPDGTIHFRARRATPTARQGIVDALVGLASECRKATEHLGRVVSFGVALPAVVDFASGAVSSAPNLPELDGFAISGELSARLGLPVLLENDATAAAIGEHWLGASREFKNIIHITLGTGVGGGLILNGEPLRGVDGTAGEVGHICVEPFGHPCGCGSVGCLEQYSSGSAVVRMAVERSAEFPTSRLTRREGLTAYDVYKAAAEGDELAIEVFRTMGFYLGIALGGLVNVLNPEAITVGGGVANGWDMFHETTYRELQYRAFQRPAERVKLVRASLGDDAGTLGVACLAIKDLAKAA